MAAELEEIINKNWRRFRSQGVGCEEPVPSRYQSMDTDQDERTKSAQISSESQGKDGQRKRTCGPWGDEVYVDATIVDGDETRAVDDDCGCRQEREVVEPETADLWLSYPTQSLSQGQAKLSDQLWS